MNPALTVVLFGLLSLIRRLSLLWCGFPFPSLTSDVLGSLVPHRANQLSSPAQKRVMRIVNASIVLGFSWPRCLASHSSRTLCLKAAKASTSGQSTIWFFLVRNLFQSFRADSPAVELYDSSHRHPVVTHKCPRTCQGMRLPNSPNCQWSLPAGYSANAEPVL